MDRFLDVWVVALLFGGFRLAGLGGAAVLGAARYYLVFALLLAAALVAVDQVVKYLVRAGIPLHTAVDFLPGLDLT